MVHFFVYVKQMQCIVKSNIDRNRTRGCSFAVEIVARLLAPPRFDDCSISFNKSERNHQPKFPSKSMT